MNIIDKLLISILGLTETMAKKVKSIMGGLIIVALANLPMTDLIVNSGLKAIWIQYLTILWVTGLASIISIVILFFGRPPASVPIPEDVEPIIDEIVDDSNTNVPIVINTDGNINTT